MFLDNEPIPVYSEDGWNYEYLPSYYPEEYVNKTEWKKTYIEYICSNTYTCELEEVDKKHVPPSMRKDNKQNIKLDIDRLQKKIRLLKKEIEVL